MTPFLLVLLASGPCVYPTQGVDARAALAAAGVTRVCVPPDQITSWQTAGFTAIGLAEPELATREALPVPGVTARPGVASPTRAPWVVASGWHIMQKPAAKYAYSLPVGKAALAAAEAFAYGADAVLAITAADLTAVGTMMAFFDSLPPVNLPVVADLAVVDDGSAVTSEVMNLLARRNLLFTIVQAPSATFPITVVVGSPEYPHEAAADPSGFAQRVRRRLTDERRSLRLFGSEVVIGRLTGDATRVRLHLLNYGGREIEGLRIRVRGSYRGGEAYVAGKGRVPLGDHVVADGATEVSLPHLVTYAVIDLR